MILDVEPTDILSDDQQELVENDAETLFGLIHARYILTNRGLQSMLEKYRAFHFGRCPRVLCKGQAMLPIGLSDVPNQDSVKLYCPRCEDVYHAKASRHEHIDGAYFGTKHIQYHHRARDTYMCSRYGKHHFFIPINIMITNQYAISGLLSHVAPSLSLSITFLACYAMLFVDGPTI